MKPAIVAATILTVAAGAASAQSVIRLATEGAYPPYNLIDDSGKVAGYDVDVGDAVCAHAHLTCEWVTNDWDSIIPNLVSGNYDAILAGMSMTEEREKVIDFTQNYLKPEPSSYVAASSDVDVKHGVIAAQTGTIQAAFVQESGATLVEFATPEETVAAVRNGEADAVLADKSYLVDYVNEDPDLAFVGEDVFLGNGLGIGVRQSDTDLRDKLDAALAEMKKDGSLNALIDKWMPNSEHF
ncbi:MAG: transporter substrate-binding domain-containing protein [Rhodobacteraceae bacterium]|nr:transporter substrate-binding domain-containing protein [Paracoccaceae bacterium]